MNRIITISIFVLLIIALAGCKNSRRGGKLAPGVIAKAGDATLTEEDIRKAITGSSPEDSVKLAHAYIETWIRKQLKAQEAEKVFAGDRDIDAMVADYRALLQGQRLDQYYIDQKVDTTITFRQIEVYYNQYKSEFNLDRPIVKGRAVRVPVSYRQTAALKELMGSSKQAAQQDFMDIVSKNGFELREYGEWINFRDFLIFLPTEAGKDYEYMLPLRTVQELSDKEYKYLVQITGSLKTGEPSPLEIVEPLIRRIIYNQRGQEAIKNAEDSLYTVAGQDKRIIINTY